VTALYIILSLAGVSKSVILLITGLAGVIVVSIGFAVTYNLFPSVKLPSLNVSSEVKLQREKLELQRERLELQEKLTELYRKRLLLALDITERIGATSVDSKTEKQLTQVFESSLTAWIEQDRDLELSLQSLKKEINITSKDA
jgi:hypothetical protein